MFAHLLLRSRPTISVKRTMTDVTVVRQAEYASRFGKHDGPSFVRQLGLFAAVLISLLSSPACGATLYVSTTGNDTNPGTSPELAWRTIAYAAEKAQAGDLVRIKGGEYGHENVVVANSGTKDAPIRFEGYDGPVKLEGTKKLEGQGVLINEKTNIKLSGITALNYRDGIVITDSHDVTVERCTAGICGWSGIALWNCHNCQVRHCTAYNADMLNILVATGRDNVVADCWSFCDPRLKPYSDYCYGAINAQDLLVTRCRGDGKLRSGHGICFTVGGGGPDSPGCSNCRVTECEMYNCWELFGVRHKGHDITFEDCYGQGKIMDMLEAKDVEKPAWCKQSYNWYNHGFYFRTGAHDILVRNCRVSGVRCGLHAEEAGKWQEWGTTKNITFQNCIATECITGIRTSNAPDARILNCLSARNKYGVDFGKAEGQSVKRSIVCQNEVGIRGRGTDQITRCNVWANTTDYAGQAKPGTKCMSKDPQFVNTSIPGTFPSREVEKRIPGPDYDVWRLKEVSPCKDVGPYADNPEASIGMR